ncbi:uncharacterized protein [Triticum aestivum]|uniref:uncharacterized protein isoform X2 n=1 Tax=Triticum aestivum TaxID=4565 RepID=UPI000843462D|nr:uncharacterized protein LOC123075318 isoform X2 [Triticum aestivum]
MHRLSRPLVSFMASAPPRGWPPALVRQVYEPPSPSTRRLSSSGESKSNEDSGKLLISSANKHSAGTQGMNNMGTRSTTSKFTACYGEVTDAGREEGTTISDGEEHERLDALKARYPFNGVHLLDEFPKSRHRDGSIYKCTHSWTTQRFADRRERLSHQRGWPQARD